MAGKAMLPHYGSPDDVERVAGFLHGKPGGASEGDLLKQLGTRCADPRKFELYDRLGLFQRDDGIFRLTETGKQFVESSARRKRQIVQTALRSFRPYHEVLARAMESGVSVLEADRVKHEWAERFADEIDLENAYRTSAAPMTFFGVCEMAGLGTFVVGRRGGKSRLELERARLERYVRSEEEPEDPTADETPAGEISAGETLGADEPAGASPEGEISELPARELQPQGANVPPREQPASTKAGVAASAADERNGRNGREAEYRDEGWDATVPAARPAVRVPPPAVLGRPARLRPADGERAGDRRDDGLFEIVIPIFGHLVRLAWVRPNMTRAEWEKFKKVGDAMFLDE